MVSNCKDNNTSHVGGETTKKKLSTNTNQKTQLCHSRCFPFQLCVFTFSAFISIEVYFRYQLTLSLPTLSRNKASYETKLKTYYNALRKPIYIRNNNVLAMYVLWPLSTAMGKRFHCTHLMCIIIQIYQIIISQNRCMWCFNHSI